MGAGGGDKPPALCPASGHRGFRRNHTVIPGQARDDGVGPRTLSPPCACSGGSR